MTQAERSDAQKRADKKYKASLMQWQVRLQPELYDELERLRESKNISRKELLEEYLKLNKEN